MSLPLPPSSSSLPEPPLNTSFPLPPEMSSLPERPERVSLPEPPEMSSDLLVPTKLSLPLVPFMSLILHFSAGISWLARLGRYRRGQIPATSVPLFPQLLETGQYGVNRLKVIVF